MDKYHIEQILGEGSYGIVYLINNKGKKYALKKVQVNPFRIDEALKQIQMMQKCIHPNLIRIYENTVSQDREKIEILMEYCEGGDLLNYYKDKKKCLQVEEILGIFRQIVKAFISMNIKGIIHRDLKPQNVLLKADKTVKIADFGCARSISQQQISRIDNFSLDKGTPIFSSPQQLQNYPYSAKCDVWSAGCLLYFLYFGIHPFMDSSVQNTLKKIKLMTENKKIELKKDCNDTIRSLLQLTLIYEDKQRATWRQLWLSRFFSPQKSDNVMNFLNYLRSISNIANWIVKEFWKHRKEMQISSGKNELFVYYTIKFQHTNTLLCASILQKNPDYAYLFEGDCFWKFNPQGLQIVKDIQKEIESSKQYYHSIRSNMSSKECFAQIKEKQMRRVSSFSDLDNSIRSAYKILTEIYPRLLENNSIGSDLDSNSTRVSQSLYISQNLGASKPIQFVWLMMAKWINFQMQFSYQKKPRIENFLPKIDQSGSINQITANIKQIKVYLQKYQYGVVQ